jgi:hypothetical protein
MLHTRIFRRLALAAGTVIAGLAAACGESTGPGDTAVTAVALSDTAVTLRMGDAVALVARTREAGGTDLVGRRVFWSTADTGVATVSQTGLVRAVAVGTTQVAASVEGRAATARVTVLARPVASLQLEPASLQLVVGARQRLTARALNDAGAVVAAAVTWTSETPATVTVTPDGEVTAVAPASAPYAPRPTASRRALQSWSPGFRSRRHHHPGPRPRCWSGRRNNSPRRPPTPEAPPSPDATSHGRRAIPAWRWCRPPAR